MHENFISIGALPDDHMHFVFKFYASENVATAFLRYLFAQIGIEISRTIPSYIDSVYDSETGVAVNAFVGFTNVKKSRPWRIEIDCKNEDAKQISDTAAAARDAICRCIINPLENVVSWFAKTSKTREKIYFFSGHALSQTQAPSGIDIATVFDSSNGAFDGILWEAYRLQMVRHYLA